MMGENAIAGPGGEMAYTSALGADAARRGGSSPLLGTKCYMSYNYH